MTSAHWSERYGARRSVSRRSLLATVARAAAVSLAGVPLAHAAVTDIGKGEPSPPPSEDDPFGRDQFWLGQGYKRVFYASPQPSDVGGSARQWFENVWSNGQPLAQYYVAPDGVAPEITRAPDGSPCIKGVIPQGVDTSIRIRGDQLGSSSNTARAVFSMEWYRPSVGGQAPNGVSGTYIGMGHLWGSSGQAGAVPAGGVTRTDSWSVRLALDKDNDYFTWVYANGQLGAAYKATSGAFRPGTERWELLEVECGMNDPHTTANGVLRWFIDGVLGFESTTFDWSAEAGILPRGHGIALRHNGGAPANETYYWRSWKIYTKG